jgi:hypothetical protein
VDFYVGVSAGARARVSGCMVNSRQPDLHVNAGMHSLLFVSIHHVYPLPIATIIHGYTCNQPECSERVSLTC